MEIYNNNSDEWEDIPLYEPKALANEFFYAEVRSYSWMYDKWEEGKIRTKTITNLIPQQRIENAIQILESREQYELCSVLQKIIVDIYIGEECFILLMDIIVHLMRMLVGQYFLMVLVW